MLQTVFINLPSPLAPLQLSLPGCTSLSSLPLPHSLSLTNDDLYLRTTTSSTLPPHATLSSLLHPDASSPSHPITLHLCARLRGGKGGFGAQLRAAGGRMSTAKADNFDSCRDLSGRRLGTIKEAQRQAELLESAPAIRAQALAADKAKLEALERKLGITPEDPLSSNPLNAEDGSGGEGSTKRARTRAEEVDLEELAKKKYRFEDNAFLEESREINENVRSAVSAALLLKKKKKAKAASAEAAKSATPTSTSVKSGPSTAAKQEKDKIAMPPPPAVSVAASSATAAVA